MCFLIYWLYNNPAKAKWHFMSNIMIHNEGQISPIIDDKTGAKSDYSLQLDKLTYQNTKDTILKLTLVITR